MKTNAVLCKFASNNSATNWLEIAMLNCEDQVWVYKPRMYILSIMPVAYLGITLRREQAYSPVNDWGDMYGVACKRTFFTTSQQTY